MTSQLQSLIPSITFLSPKPSPTFLSPKPSFPPPPPLLRLSLTPKPTPFRLVATRARAKPKSPSGEQKWTHEGSVTESLPNGMFRVLLDNKDLIIGYISGKIRKNFVRILPGDRVKVEVSRYDTSRGRIVYRHRTGAKDLSAD